MLLANYQRVLLFYFFFDLQALQWECPAGLKNNEVLKVQVFDHETIGIGKNR